MNTMKIVLIFGPPGSGKDTQAEKINEKIDVPLISTGGILRQEAKKGTAVSKKIKTTIDKGKMISTELMNKILEDRLEEEDTKEGFILNGYPREKLQLEYIKKKIKEFQQTGQVDILAININVGDEEIKQRLGGRRECPGCGATYHMKYAPPKENETCDICKRGLRQREDDREEVIEERLEIFYNKIKPVLTYFKKNRQLVEINGEQSIKEVEKEIERKMKQKGFL
ncbi:MAG: adenylate kinase family protein [Patescibacteria group bacterium]